jgi:transcriptional regulator with PAS, ATPase and Fis domain
VGSTSSFCVDIRVIAATNRPTASLRGQYMREDLYYRLATIVLEIPPLRARPEDVFVLAHQILKRLSDRYGRQLQLSRPGWDLLLKYEFPGNVRELQNLLEGVAVFSSDDPQIISDKDLMPLLQVPVSPQVSLTQTDQPIAIEPLERMAIQRALRLARGNRTKAATLLGISRDTLYRKLREFSELTSQPTANSV